MRGGRLYYCSRNQPARVGARRLGRASCRRSGRREAVQDISFASRVAIASACVSGVKVAVKRPCGSIT